MPVLRDLRSLVRLQCYATDIVHVTISCLYNDVFSDGFSDVFSDVQCRIVLCRSGPTARDRLFLWRPLCPSKRYRGQSLICRRDW